MRFYSENKIEERKQKQVLHIYQLLDNHKFHRVLQECDQFLELTPSSEKVRLVKAIALQNLGDYDGALDMIDDEKSYIFAPKKALLLKLGLFCLKGMYKEAQELIRYIYMNLEMDEQDAKELAHMDMSVLAILDKEELENQYYGCEATDYFYSQLINYDLDCAIEYMKKLQHNISKESNEWSFIECVDMENLFLDMASRIKNMEPLNDVIYDSYYIYYPSCGMALGKTSDYIKVSTIKNTKKIMKIRVVPNSDVLNNSIISASLPSREDSTKSETVLPKKDMIKRFNDRFKKSV